MFGGGGGGLFSSHIDVFSFSLIFLLYNRIKNPDSLRYEGIREEQVKKKQKKRVIFKQKSSFNTAKLSF